MEEITKNMSAPHIFARFIFHAQVFYYLFFYILLSTPRKMDMLFFSMLITYNLHYVFKNTGIYKDLFDKLVFKRPADKDYEDDDEDWIKKSSDVLPLVYQIKIADQDSLADIISLLLVPSMLTVLTVLATREAMSSVSNRQYYVVVSQIKVQHFDGNEVELSDIWIRFIVMVIARLVSSRLTRAIFLHKIKFLQNKIVNSMDNMDLLHDNVQRDLWRAKIAYYAAKAYNTSAIILANQQDIELNYFLSDEEISKMVSEHHQTDEYAQQPSNKVEKLHQIIVQDEFFNCLPYFCLVVISCSYSCFQDPLYPARFSYCQFVNSVS